MAEYQIYINERTAIGKSIMSLLRSVPEAVSIEKTTAQEKHVESKLYGELKDALHDVKEIRAGRQKRVTIDEFLNEVRSNNS